MFFDYSQMFQLFAEIFGFLGGLLMVLIFVISFKGRL